jgi:hypothetical protein
MKKYKTLVLVASFSFIVGVFVARITKIETSQSANLPRITKASKRSEKNTRTAVTHSTSSGAVTMLDKFENSKKIAEMAKLDPVRSLKLLRSTSEGKIDELSCRLIFETWAQTDSKAAIDYARLPENRDIEFHATDAILGVMFKRNPEEAFATLLGFERNGLTDSLTDSLFSKWASYDTKGLLGALSKLQSSSAKFIGISRAAEAIGSRNPDQCITYIDSLTNATEKNIALSGLVNGWSSVDPESAAKYIEKLNKTGVVNDAISISLLRNWSIKDPSSALNWAASLKGLSERTSALSHAVLFMQSSSLSSHELVKIIDGLDPGHDKDNALSTLIVNWKGENFKELAEMAYSTGSALPGTAGEAALVSKWARINPQQAEEFMNNNGGARKNLTLAKELISNVVESDPAKAEKWIVEADPNGNRGIAEQAIDSLMKSDPEKATKMFEALSKHGETDGLLASFVSSYSSYFPEKSIEWVSSHQDINKSGDLAKLAFEKWVQSDEYSASTYIAKMQESQLKNIAVSSLASSLAESDLSSSLKWAVSISDENLRRETLKAISHSIDLSQAEKYEQSILESGISDDEIELLERR